MYRYVITTGDAVVLTNASKDVRCAAAPMLNPFRLQQNNEYFNHNSDLYLRQGLCWNALTVVLSNRFDSTLDHLLSMPKTVSLLCVPVADIDGFVCGALEVACSSTRSFTQNDLSVLQSLAGFICPVCSFSVPSAHTRPDRCCCLDSR